MFTKKTLVALATLSISASLCADAYSDSITRIINDIANEYDAPARFLNVDEMTSAALKAVNFIVSQNDISKNSPLGRKNKYITKHAQTLEKLALKLQELIAQSNTIPEKPSKKQAIIQDLNRLELHFKQLEGEIEEIKKKQLLPLAKVQKDLINILVLLAAKNLEITQHMILVVGKL
jgi:hypothetical protein